MDIDGGDHAPIPHMRLDHLQEGAGGDESKEREPPGQLLRHELKSVVLLILLYCLQGVPLGLAFGSIPFLLQQKASYSQIGAFSFASWPYSLKLLWSPLVDSVYIRTIGRRKSWIIPAQCLAGIFMVLLSYKIDDFVSEAHHIPTLTGYFFCLIFLIATQDIAVDGWALTLLSKRNVGYAATCQTIGLNLGYFVSFTIFLALNSPEFCNRYVRKKASPSGLVQLSSYLRFWGWVYLLFSLGLLLLKKETERAPTTPAAARAHRSPPPEAADDEAGEERPLARAASGPPPPSEGGAPSVGSVYRQMWSIIRLPNMRTLISLLLVCRLAFAAADAATALKFLDRGFRREDMALLVLIEFPFEIAFAVLAGRWSSGSTPLFPWLNGYRARLILCPVGALLVYFMPVPSSSSAGVPLLFYGLVLLYSLVVSLASTTMFVCICAFFSRISDASVGGTYMTLLNTLANLGGTWPRSIVLFLIDYLTSASCRKGSELVALPPKQVCTSGSGKEACTKAGGLCDVGRDGYYVMCLACLAVGAALLAWIARTVRYLHTVRPADWRLT